MPTYVNQRPSINTVLYAYNHVVLPPRLPQQDDADPSHEHFLLHVVQQALRALEGNTDDSNVKKAIASGLASVKNLRDGRDSHGSSSECQVRELLHHLVSTTAEGYVPLEVKAQNAGLLIRRDGREIIFESFELSPINKDAMSTIGRLVRTFPGGASKLPTTALQLESLQSSLSHTIAKMITQKAHGTQPCVKKDGLWIEEERDTTDPTIVTSWLMNYIASLGGPTTSQRINKNTREEVLWSDCKYPWRRSSLWLLIRVTLQLLFERHGTGSGSLDGIYKAFIVQVLSHILDEVRANWKHIGSETIYIICAKMARRLRKMERLGQLQCLQPRWRQEIEISMTEAYNSISHHWATLSRLSTTDFDLTALRGEELTRDLDVSLPVLDIFLTSLEARVPETAVSGFQPSIAYPTFAAADLPRTIGVDGEYKTIVLAAFEAWVEEHLSTWIARTLANETVCRDLRDLIEDYHCQASAAYTGIPVSLSIMYLTILELWVACDRSACHIYPLLTDYQPDVPLDETQCLALPQKRQMERLSEAERYVRSRKDAATHTNPSVFCDFGSSSSFGVRYFRQSLDLQRLLARIEQDASTRELEKCKELEDLQRYYRNLMDLYNTQLCETHEVFVDDYYERTEPRHRSDCARCALKHKADKLNIDIYEWPLSSNTHIAQATLFELALPEAFGDWRDATWYLVVSVLGCRNKKPVSADSKQTLDRHYGLSHMLSPRYSRRRIIPLSSVKAHTGTHRKQKKAIVNVQKSEVCLPNALRYAYFDKTLGTYTTAYELTEELPQQCMHKIPNAKSKVLERFLYRPPSHPDGPPPNEVIAGLADCPAHFSIDEYKAFGMLSLGQEIIYSNVLAQLAAPAVDFSKPETQIHLLQIVWQVGAESGEGDARRVTHQILGTKHFAHAMLTQLEIAMDRIAGNWESWRACAVFVALARRVLSITQSTEIQNRSLQLLDTARLVSREWLHRLKNRITGIAIERQRNELLSRATEIALLCASTFDVDNQFVDHVLQIQSATSTLLQCSIHVQQNYLSVETECQDIYRAMLQSWRSLLYRIFPKLRNHLLLKNTELNNAVLKNWTSFQPPLEGTWKVLGSEHKHWLHAESGLLPVHYNLLTGELLVNGLPLARLPSNYIDHPMYNALFGNATLEVVPTDEPGMRFSAKSMYRGCKLHFGMEGQDMYLVAMQHGKKLDLLPSRLFKGHLPSKFVERYIHWYDHDEDMVLFRPRDDAWSSDSAGWRLIREGRSWHLVNGSEALFSMSSITARLLSKVFNALEDDQHIHIILDTAAHSVLIVLPRLQLDFIVNLSDICKDISIQSRQYREMIVDTDQSTGVLVGLSSKLVLRSSKPCQDRIMIVPAPRNYDARTVAYALESSQQHTSVHINREQVHGVFTYSLDTTLGRVLDDGDMQRKLFLAFLHVLTSHCLPDPLTGYTGTESALQILKSAAVRSFERLTTKNVELLGRIQALSPLRTFYPADLMVMQQIVWDPAVPVLSQHPHLRACCKDLIHQAEKMQFYPDSTPDITSWKYSNAHLEARDLIRSATYRVCDFGGELFTSERDAHYTSRDIKAGLARGQRAYIAATLILRDTAALHSEVLNLKANLLQNHFETNAVQGSSEDWDPTRLRYDTDWLSQSSAILAKGWCNFHRALPIYRGNRYDLAAWLSTLAFSESADMGSIQTLAAFCRMSALAVLEPPPGHVFNLQQGADWNAFEIRGVLQRCSRSFNSSKEATLPKNGSESFRQHNIRLQALFQSRRDTSIHSLLTALQHQWPCANPVCPAAVAPDEYIELSSAMSCVVGKFVTWYRNRSFLEYLCQLSDVMAQQDVVPVELPRHIATEPLNRQILNDEDRTFPLSSVLAADSAILSRRSMVDVPFEPRLPIVECSILEASTTAKTRLQQLCRSLQRYARSECEKDYVNDLRESCAYLERYQNKIVKRSLEWSDTHVRHILLRHLNACEEFFERLGERLSYAASSNGSISERLGLNIQHSLRLSPTFWLSQLHRDRFTSLSEAWKTAIIEYGLAVTCLRRAQRLLLLSDQPADLIEEIVHTGHSNWQPRDFPETLLLEAESGILLREEQETIASHMRSPSSSSNTVLQLFMGGGKSSVIVPAVAAFLSDKENLVRVIVAKPQSKQMLQMLVAKLGYLLNRRIYHMPLSRALRPDTSQAALIRQIHDECIANRGVMLVQPEHILSFKLMAVEAGLSGQACAQSLLDTQMFLDNVARDIVDESDENFSVKFELVYTMGSQRPIEFAPERWHVIQAVVSLVPRFAARVKQTFPDAIDIQGNDHGRFARVGIHHSDAADALLSHLAKHIVKFGILGLPTSSQSPKVQAALSRYILEVHPSPQDVEMIETSRFWTTTTEPHLLLVRGLIAGGILRFALSSKRWRVNFGLDEHRTPKTKLAVPFRSKDNPSPRSEFSHPDVVILLTLLSYYYGGLTDEEMFDGFTHLQHSDQATIHYDEWVNTASADLPSTFRHLSSVSIKDRHQCSTEIFPHLRYSKNAIDYYLSSLVFPKAMKEFPHKLSASGWDIGAIKKRPLTGFSGTNDTRHLLPLSVQHLDLPSQSHTNALVLRYLLRDENSVECLPRRRGGTDAEHVLSAITRMQPEVRVLLDCGASILEQSNREVAETWLSMRHQIVEAVVFFEDETISVLDRRGHVEPLQTSPFAKQLDLCIIYLDEAHTRGTDLKLPRGYRAGVTLGPALTKDKLTQGCMRMRKLGHGQSVVFISPEEVSSKIRERTCKTSDNAIEVADVLLWSIGETWEDLKRSMPLWAIQGARFERNRDLLCGTATPTQQLRDFLEDEAQSLKVRYRPCFQRDWDAHLLGTSQSDNYNIALIVKRCQEFNASKLHAATLSEEQERELAPEIEEERQIERPPRLDPASHRVHPALQKLVRTGKLTTNAEAFVPAFRALASTSAAELFDITQLPTNLLVTSDYLRTVERPTGSVKSSFVSDSYQRPVQFVLSVPDLCDPCGARELIIISPFEANALFGIIVKEEKVTLHLFAPRFNVSYAPLDKLELYNVGHEFCSGQITRSMIFQLNLFAGSLYLRSFDEYNELCDFLGLLRSEPSEGQLVFADGFLEPPTGKWGLRSSPVPFLRTLLMKIRREGDGVEKTHLGKVLSGIKLERIDFRGKF